MCVAAIALATTRTGYVAPAADLVVVWAPGANIAPIEAVARRAGAAVIDRSPTAPTTASTAELLQHAIAAYDDTHYDDAAKDLLATIAATDATGALDLSAGQLSDLFLYSGLVKLQLSDASGAWDDFVIAAVTDPTRMLDPQRFPPKVVDEFGRAKETAGKRDLAHLTVQAPIGCSVSVDGTLATGTVDRVAGPHWVRVLCPDSAPLGRRVELAAGSTMLPLNPQPYQPPSDADVLIQARASSVRGVVVVEVHNEIGSARLLGLDGRVRDRRTVSVHADLAPLARAIEELLAPAPVHRWYDSRWAWAGGGAALAAAILVPLTIGLVGGNHPSDAAVRPKGLPSPW